MTSKIISQPHSHNQAYTLGDVSSLPTQKGFGGYLAILATFYHAVRYIITVVVQYHYYHDHFTRHPHPVTFFRRW